ncbi:hypothetical protein FRUB_05216 [Fimbriiglobus ruber]|uniref:Uncharacterized protein n=1 Tax=Fimbriiglobus ruber TaxID=1908690 RepID=A0A225DVT2_9BACT|nr:hypothetical protein FRUB_05216 [Fimbriiglobus ruber]
MAEHQGNRDRFLLFTSGSKDHIRSTSREIEFQGGDTTAIGRPVNEADGVSVT